jgi:hypothetical protein
LLAGTGIALTGALSGYLTIVDQSGAAVLNFDPTGHGGGSAVAVLHGLGGSVIGFGELVAQGAIRMG